MKTKKFLIPAVLLLLGSFIFGCAAFRAGHLPSVSPWPPLSTASKRSISIVVSGEVMVNGSILKGKEQDVPPIFLTAWQEQVVKTYSESGLFSDVKIGASGTDLRTEVEITDRSEINLAMGFLSLLTLRIIPSHITESFIVKTVIKDQDGKILGTFEKSETITHWNQLFLIFATPFHFPPSVVRETLSDLNRATIQEAHTQSSLL